MRVTKHRIFRENISKRLGNLISLSLPSGEFGSVKSHWIHLAFMQFNRLGKHMFKLTCQSQKDVSSPVNIRSTVGKDWT